MPAVTFYRLDKPADPSYSKRLRMHDAWLWLQSPSGMVLAGFHAFIIAMLALDLGVFHGKSHAISLREAGAWSVVWVGSAGLFAVGIWQYWGLWDPLQPELGPEKSLQFIVGYVVEQSLSIDNLFVFLVIFRYFGVPAEYRHSILVWGILGAVFMRAVFIVTGAALLHYFAWTTYIFAVILLYSAYKLAYSVEEEVDPGRNRLLRLVRRFVPVIDTYDSPRFWVKRDGRWHATPLPLVLLVVESMDVMFAVDSVPAILAITKDPFIAYTSNIFAVIGLRSFFFLLAGFLGMFRYLNLGLSAIMGLVGLKLIVEKIFHEQLEPYHMHITLASLAVIAIILVITITASVLAGPASKDNGEAASPSDTVAPSEATKP